MTKRTTAKKTPTKKPPAKTTKAKEPKDEMVKVGRAKVTALANAVVWALKFLQEPRGGGMHFNLTTGESKPWQEKFMDALEGVGIVVDRKEFWKKQNKKRR